MQQQEHKMEQFTPLIINTNNIVTMYDNIDINSNILNNVDNSTIDVIQYVDIVDFKDTNILNEVDIHNAENIINDESIINQFESQYIVDEMKYQIIENQNYNQIYQNQINNQHQKKNKQENDLLKYINQQYNKPSLSQVLSKLDNHQKRNFNKLENEFMYMCQYKQVQSTSLNDLSNSNDPVESKYNLLKQIEKQYVTPSVENIIQNCQNIRNIKKMRKKFESKATQFDTF